MLYLAAGRHSLAMGQRQVAGQAAGEDRGTGGRQQRHRSTVRVTQARRAGSIRQQENQARQARFARSQEFQLRVRERFTSNKGSVTKPDYRYVNLTLTYPSPTVIRGLAVPRGEVMHIDRGHLRAAHSIQGSPNKGPVFRGLGHVRGMAHKHLACFHSTPP